VHRGDDRLWQVGEGVEALVHPAQALVEVLCPLGLRPAGDPVLGHPEIDSGAEGTPLGTKYDDADRGVEADLVGPFPELSGGLPGPRVELVRMVERQRRDPVRDVELEHPVGLGLDGLHAHHVSKYF
jgi:hypothetical protein